MKFATKHTQHYPSRLKHVTALPWDINNSNFLQSFSRYGNTAKKLHFQCTDFNSSMRITVYMLSVFMCFYQNLVLIAECHVDC